MSFIHESDADVLFKRSKAPSKPKEEPQKGTEPEFDEKWKAEETIEKRPELRIPDTTTYAHIPEDLKEGD